MWGEQAIFLSIFPSCAQMSHLSPLGCGCCLRDRNCRFEGVRFLFRVLSQESQTTFATSYKRTVFHLLTVLRTAACGPMKAGSAVPRQPGDASCSLYVPKRIMHRIELYLYAKRDTQSNLNVRNVHFGV